MFRPYPDRAWRTALAALACLLAATATPAFAFATTRPTAIEAAAAMGKGFNLGQMFDASQHPATPETAAAKIDAYYDRGFRVVRIPVTWTEAVDGSTLADPETGRIDQASVRFKALETVIDYALTRPGLFVVINAHHETRLKDGGRADILAALWSDIADRFKNRDGRLMFEILNEPHLSDHAPMAPETLRRMTGQAWTRIRAIDPARNVLIGGHQWFGAHEMAIAWPELDAVGGGADPHLMATFHHYNPWTFNGDHQGDYADSWTATDIAGPMRQMADWASTTGGGMPVFIGEWGVGWKSRLSVMDCNNIRAWYAAFDAAHARAYAMPTAVWDDGGWFQLWDHEANSFSSNLVDCIDGACAWTELERFNRACG